MYLYSQTKGKWEQTLNQLQKVGELEKVPGPRIQQKLKAITDELLDKQRERFLDIACFLTGEESVACYLWPDRGSILKGHLSIVKIENGKLWMHDEL